MLNKLNNDPWMEFGLLADPLRRAIIDKLLDGPLHATTIAKGMSVTPSAVSQQLAILTGADLTKRIRNGRYIIYSLNPIAMKRLVEQLDSWRKRVEQSSKNIGFVVEKEQFSTDVVDDKMDRWAHQWDQLDPMTVGLTLRLYLVMEALNKNLESVTARFGLNATEFRLLALLDRIGPPHEGSLSTLSKMALKPMSFMSKHIDHLAEQELIVRLPEPQGGQSKTFKLTHKGQALFHHVMEYRRIYFLNPLYRMSYEKKKSIIELTRILIRSLK